MTAFGEDAPDPAFFDLSQWPVVFVRFPELHEHDRVDRVLGGLDRILERRQPFVVVWLPATHDHDDEPHDDEKKASAWLKKWRPALNTYCKGYVYMTADPALQQLFIRRIRTVSKIYSFQMIVVASREEANATGRRLLSVPERNAGRRAT